MPVQIGSSVHGYAEPTGLLSDCHRRIEMFLGALQAVAKVMDQPRTEEAARALEGALRYFREAAPKHTADEEESLFPRMRKMDDAEIRSALTKLEDLEQDHRMAEPLHAEVERLGNKYLSAGRIELAEVQTFREAVARLAALYQQHIRIEDLAIFPLAARLLPQAEQKAIGLEMAARRATKTADVPPVPIQR